MGADDYLNSNSAPWQAAKSLVQRTWFSRLWILQEVALAGNIEMRCGATTISGDEFFRAVSTIIVPGPFLPTVNVIPHFQKAYRLGLLKEQLSSASLHSYPDLAHTLSGWDCSDDRDRLNALFGMVFRDIDSQSTWFTPNYNLSTPELFEHFAVKNIEFTQSLDILHFAGDCRLNVLQYPVYDDIRSWVPDWRI